MVAERRNGLRIGVDREGDTVVLVPVVDCLGSDGFSDLVREFERFLRADAGRIILDFQWVNRMTFAACAFLAQMKRLAARAGCEMAVRNRPARLRAEMSLYRIDEAIDSQTQYGHRLSA